MRKLLLSTMAVLALGVTAHAADLGVAPLYKAPALGGPYPTKGCGTYYGVNALASASPTQDATPGATAIGGDIGGTFGWTCQTSPTTFWFVEGMADFQNLNGSGAGFALSGPIHLEQRVGFGGPINSMLSVLPNLNTP